MQIENSERLEVPELKLPELELDIELEKEGLLDSARFKVMIAAVLVELLLYVLYSFGIENPTPEQIALVQHVATMIAVLVTGWIFGRSFRNTAV